VLGHEGLAGANARITSAEVANRGASGDGLPSVLLDDPAVSRPFEFQTTRAGEPGPSVLELDVTEEQAAAVTQESPLEVYLETRLRDGEHVLAVGNDGEFYLPVGFGREVDGFTQVKVERLPTPTAADRGLARSARIFFQKLVARPLGLEHEHPLLAAAVVEDGRVRFRKKRADVAGEVAAADRILLFVPGFVGDTAKAVAAISSFAKTSGDATVANPYDAVLVFEYDALGTPIAQSARDLSQRLEMVGLEAGHGKTVHVVAHSLGGLVARWFVEQEGGKEVVSHVVLAGTPNGGSPWATLQDWATAAISFSLNLLAASFWPASAVAGLVHLVERADKPIDEMRPDSATIEALATSPDPGLSYTVLAGNTSLKPEAFERDGEAGETRLERLLNRLRFREKTQNALGAVFFGAPNDVAVSVKSAERFASGREPPPHVVEVASDHLMYFTGDEGRKALAAALAEGDARVGA
jgi:pimeloyl-ACP methyl ester carboxylesterase